MLLVMAFETLGHDLLALFVPSPLGMPWPRSITSIRTRGHRNVGSVQRPWLAASLVLELRFRLLRERLHANLLVARRESARGGGARSVSHDA